MSTPAPPPLVVCPNCGYIGAENLFQSPPIEEFPKMLYQGTPDNFETLVVNNTDEETAAKADGWTDSVPVAKKDEPKKDDKAAKPEQHSGGHLFGGHKAEEPAKKK